MKKLLTGLFLIVLNNPVYAQGDSCTVTNGIETCCKQVSQVAGQACGAVQTAAGGVADCIKLIYSCTQTRPPLPPTVNPDFSPLKEFIKNMQ